MHGVTEKELGAVGYGNEKISLPVQANAKLPLYLAHLNALIRRAFGVQSVTEREIRVSDESYAIRFFGPTDRVLLAQYAYEVVFRTMNAGWTKHLAEHPYLKGARGARSGFLVGWIQAVQETIMDFGVTEEETKRTELVKTEHYGHSLVKLQPAKIGLHASTHAAGQSAAADFRLHRPVTQERLKIALK
jgi:hypothetical protein